jgi:GrpB-like predicted nucleotidyltransferase (UPF0157 family)
VVETLEEKIARVLKDHVELVPHDRRWKQRFEEERDHLFTCLPRGLISRVEHFGSTAIPGICAKPIVDILVGVRSLEETRERVVPVLEAQGYDYFWRASSGEDTPPFYAWFIKRDERGTRTHHIHMVEADFESWDRLLFRDYLVAHPEVARSYADLKVNLSHRFPDDRVAYTDGKGDFVRDVTEKAKAYYRAASTQGAI